MTDHETPRCHFAGKDQPRMLRTHVRDCEDSACGGCVPCPERHCAVCYREHVTVDGRGTDQTCTDCIRAARTDIKLIVDLSTRMLGEAIMRGINSQAAMLAGPAADAEAWGYRRMSALAGRIGKDFIEDNHDEQHPLWVLGTWDMLVAEHLGQDRDARVTITDAAGYLDGHLTRLAHDQRFAFDELVTEVHTCRTHLENVLREGEQVDRGAPCPMCGNANLEKQHGDKVEDDRWVCPRRDCRSSYTEHDYRSKVQAVYMVQSDRLTASQIAATYRVPEGTVRRWASGDNPPVKTHGKDESGRQLYNVADVLAQRDRKASA